MSPLVIGLIHVHLVFIFFLSWLLGISCVPKISASDEFYLLISPLNLDDIGDISSSDVFYLSISPLDFNDIGEFNFILINLFNRFAPWHSLLSKFYFYSYMLNFGWLRKCLFNVYYFFVSPLAFADYSNLYLKFILYFIIPISP